MQRLEAGLAVSAARRVRAHLRKTLFAGFLTLVPLAATVWVVRLVFVAIDGWVQPAVRWVFGREITGIGAVVTLALIYLTGLLVANYLGRMIVAQIESGVLRLPFVRWVYNVAKDAVDSVKAMGDAKFQVVLIEWPRKGLYNVGFVTSSFEGEGGRAYYNVLVPSSPLPQSDYLATVSGEEIVFTDMPFEHAAKLVFSSGVITPAGLAAALQKHARAP